MTPPEEGGTWISSGQIYAELRRIGDEVMALRGELKEVAELRSALAKTESRTTALERRVWTASGGAAAVGMATPYMLRLIGG